MERIAILTSGGDAPGMNPAVRAVVRLALNKGMEVFAVERGYHGLLRDEIHEMNSRSVSDIIQRGGTILKTARSEQFATPEGVKKAADILRSHKIDYLVVIGGDGSFRGAEELSKHGINVIGIPGTIDNDLAYTDYTLGFDTAVNTCLAAINNLRDTMGSHERCSCVEVMGRRCGDIALYAGVCGGAEFILVPEMPFDLDEIAKTLKASRERGKTSNMIVFAEGAGNRDEILKELSEKAGVSFTVTTLGHIQRGGSPTMADRILATKFAYRAIEIIQTGSTNRVIGVKNNRIVDYDIEEALAMPRHIDKSLYEMGHILGL